MTLSDRWCSSLIDQNKILTIQLVLNIIEYGGKDLEALRAAIASVNELTSI